MSKEANWYVLTGGPSSGKTATLDSLSLRGYVTIPEAARMIINQDLTDGKTINQIRGNEAEFQERVLMEKIRRERSFPRKITAFIDRGIPDSVAYYQKLGLDIPSEYQKKSRFFPRYKEVFFLESLPFVNDYARTETEEESLWLSELLYSVYLKAGYNPIRIPVMPIEERVEAILKRIRIQT